MTRKMDTFLYVRASENRLWNAINCVDIFTKQRELTNQNLVAVSFELRGPRYAKVTVWVLFFRPSVRDLLLHG